MSKPSKLQQAMAVMAAVTSGQLDDATAADLRALLDAAAAGQNLTKALDRALSAARSRTWEQVADAALAAAAEGAGRGERTRVKQAVASAAAVRRLERRLSGDFDDAQNGTPAGAVADAQNGTPATSPADAELHAAEDTAEGTGWHAVQHTETDRAEVSL